MGSLTGDYYRGLAVAAALPVALRIADGMARYAINSYLEYDEEDEDAPTLLGFALKGVVVSAVFVVMVLLVMTGVANVLEATVIPADAVDVYGASGLVAALLEGATIGFKAAAFASVASFMTAPAYLMALRRRDRAGKDTSGIALRVTAEAIALALFVACACVLVSGVVG